jgi:hypothetical protein
MLPVIVSVLLALVPLAGIGWIITRDALLTVDGLFMALILLTIAGILFLNAALELRGYRRKGTAKATAGASAKPQLAAKASVLRQRGRVEKVMFFEAPVGYPDKSIVTLRNGTGSPHLLAFEGDLRNALPEGKVVEIAYRANGQINDLVALDYVSTGPRLRQAA